MAQKRFTISIPMDLYQRLKTAAGAKHQDTSHFIAAAIQDYLSRNGSGGPGGGSGSSGGSSGGNPPPGTPGGIHLFPR